MKLHHHLKICRPHRHQQDKVQLFELRRFPQLVHSHHSHHGRKFREVRGLPFYFGVYPEYISQSKKLILVGGFYGINEHHVFVPFATVILTLLKKEE
jgi:hypothetical protein